MITIRDLFERPIDREIDGVIKADDDSHLAQELEEYVVTTEIERQLGRFAEAYGEGSVTNGVWISGFFGSGKSHLLKMLAFLLENREIAGRRSWDLFRPKVAEDALLDAGLGRAISIPSRSILFNIDQKAAVIAKDQPDALLAVFQKVFDEHCGYYGKEPHIAAFERALAGRGLLTAFQEAYARIAGQPWTTGREETVFEGGNIDRAFLEVAGASAGEARDVIDRYRSDHRVSIEDFAESVRAYIDAQGPGFRLNFFVDEVGQYIADNVKLMTNLQTVAESLASRCGGRAWLMVTAQQDIAAVIGDRDRAQENDFSKIQARFGLRMPLTSADVAEVIAKRLLAKTPAAQTALGALHAREGANLRTLFGFADGSMRLQDVRDEAHFIGTYPFVPYQFPLLQLAIQGLAQHNAFEGRFSSVGERSMLQVFREVAIAVKDEGVGSVAAFDRMYDGLAPSLKSDVQQSILTAERNLGDAYAVRVLKALFLVKYVNGFKATARNVAVLLVDRLDDDPAARRQAVEQALGELEHDSYVRRDGEHWEFLTNDEKDVDEEIKAVDIDLGEIRAQIDKIVFETVLNERRMRHEASGQSFDYTRRVDEQAFGRARELSIDLVTSLHDLPGGEAARARSLTTDGLAVVLANDDRFIRDVRAWLRTEKFVRQSLGGQGSETRKRIILERRGSNDTLGRTLAAEARALLGSARLFARGEELNLPSAADGAARIAQGFQVLVDRVHTNLAMLGGRSFGEGDVAAAFAQARANPGLDLGAPSEPARELINQIAADARRGVRTTARALVQRFTQKPYGWSYFAVLATIAGLIACGRMEARLDGAVLEPNDAAQALGNDRKLDGLVLESQAEFTPQQTRRLREFLREMFDADPQPGADARALGRDAATRTAALLAELERLAGDAARYPFLRRLEPLIDTLRPLDGQSPAWFLGELDEATRERLVELREEAFDPIRRWAGQGRAEHDAALALIGEQAANLDHADPAHVVALRDALAAEDAYRAEGERRIRAAADALRDDIARAVTAARGEAAAAITALMAKLSATDDFARAPEAIRGAVTAEGEAAVAAVRAATLVPVARQRAADFRDHVWPRLLARLAQPGTAPVPDPAESIASTGTGTPVREIAGSFTPDPPATPTFVNAHQLSVPFTKAYLADQGDVDAYLEALGRAMAAAIGEGKRITV